jgi:hypothetical protein
MLCHLPRQRNVTHGPEPVQRARSCIRVDAPPCPFRRAEFYDSQGLRRHTAGTIDLATRAAARSGRLSVRCRQATACNSGRFVKAFNLFRTPAPLLICDIRMTHLPSPSPSFSVVYFVAHLFFVTEYFTSTSLIFDICSSFYLAFTSSEYQFIPLHSVTILSEFRPMSNIATLCASEERPFCTRLAGCCALFEMNITRKMNAQNIQAGMVVTTLKRRTARA